MTGSAMAAGWHSTVCATMVFVCALFLLLALSCLLNVASKDILCQITCLAGYFLGRELPMFPLLGMNLRMMLVRRTHLAGKRMDRLSLVPSRHLSTSCIARRPNATECILMHTSDASLSPVSRGKQELFAFQCTLALLSLLLL
jgi:hypothetical protein